MASLAFCLIHQLFGIPIEEIRFGRFSFIFSFIDFYRRHFSIDQLYCHFCQTTKIDFSLTSTFGETVEYCVVPV